MPSRARREAYFKRHGVPMPAHWNVRSKEYRRRYRAERTARLRELKRRPCADCGGIFDPVCMDFDHRPGEVKTFELASINGGGKSHRSWAEILVEIAKCDVVCANCHRIRTHRKRNHAAICTKSREERKASADSPQLSILHVLENPMPDE